MKRFISLLVCATLVLSLACVVSAADYTDSSWSPTLTVDVPGWNGNYTTVTSRKKVTSSQQFSVHTYANEAWGLFGTDACLSNSDYTDYYSDWVRNMRPNNTLRGIVYVSFDTICHATISTDMLEPNTITVRFCYSPDRPESLE